MLSLACADEPDQRRLLAGDQLHPRLLASALSLVQRRPAWRRSGPFLSFPHRLFFPHVRPIMADGHRRDFMRIFEIAFLINAFAHLLRSLTELLALRGPKGRRRR
jgi:hypothetical protein